MTAKKDPTPEKKVEVKKPTPKVAEPVKPSIETDIENLQKLVSHLETKAKSQGEQIHLMKSITDSCEGMIRDLHEKIKKVAAVSGVLI